MNKPVIAGIAAGVLLAGIILGPIPGFFGAQAQEEENTGGNIKQVTLIASEEDVQVAPDNALHPGGVMYRAMVFNGTIPGPVISVDQGDTMQVLVRSLLLALMLVKPDLTFSLARA
jgi:FtsP/CotA-like multicopper oxidase with cupredoxin domain